MSARKALSEAIESRKALEQAVRQAITAIGHVPEDAVIAALPDDHLQAVLDHHRGPLIVA